MLKTSEVAELTNLTDGAIRYLRCQMPDGYARKLHNRQWLFEKKAVEWVLTRTRRKPGRKRKNEKLSQNV